MTVKRKYMTAMQNANILASQEQHLFTEITREHKSTPEVQKENNLNEREKATQPKQANK